MKGKNILITGMTGSFGQAFTRYAIDNLNFKKLICYSRGELQQAELQEKFTDKRLRYFIGDIQDKDRLKIALHGVDTVIHTAALKRIDLIEYNPFEVVKTNILGSQNLIEAAIDCGVKKVIALSTDKACNPINAYGASKLMMEKLFVSGNSYASGTVTKFSVVRYGNVINSRGSVVPLFREKRDTGKIPITHKDMTRFWITLERACKFVDDALRDMQGGEIFIPKLSTCRIIDLAKAIAPDCEVKYIGIRPGEKLHETLISQDEMNYVVEQHSRYIILPAFKWFDRGNVSGNSCYIKEYNSSNEDIMLNTNQIRALL